MNGPTNSERKRKASESTRELPQLSPSAGLGDQRDLEIPESSDTVPRPPRAGLPVLAGRFRMRNIIGYGSYGLVFRGLDEQSRGEVAIKILKSANYGDQFIERHWAREQKLAARLDISGAPKGYTWGNEDQRGARVSYLVTELIEGETLKEWRLERDSVERDEINALALAIARVLAEFQELGLIHRDIKPGNIMVKPNGQVKIMDFGLHRFVDEEPAPRSKRAIGTPHYMPPELIAGLQGGLSSDIYSFAHSLFFIIEGHPAFEGGDVVEVLKSHRRDPMPDLSGAFHGSTLETMIHAMGGKKPARRPKIDDIIRALEEM